MWLWDTEETWIQMADERINVKIYPDTYAEVLKIMAGVLKREGRKVFFDSANQEKSLMRILIDSYNRRYEWNDIT